MKSKVMRVQKKSLSMITPIDDTITQINHDNRLSIRNVNYQMLDEFGLSIRQVFEDSVRKAKVLGLIAGQASSLYQMNNLRIKG